MSSITIDGWVAPTIETLNFSTAICDVAAKWIALYSNSIEQDSTQADLAFEETFEYVKALTPSNMTQPTFPQAVAWIATEWDEPIMGPIFNFATFNCSNEVCKQLVWAGDTDLAGIGVMIVYYLAGILTTLYFIFIAIDHLGPFKNNDQARRRWKYLVSGFQESLQSFLDTGLLFSVTLLAAAVYRHGSSRIHPDKSHSIFELTNAIYLGLFNIMPPLMLQLVLRNAGRTRIRAMLWLVTIILATALGVMYGKLATSVTQITNLIGRSSAVPDALWEINCEPFALRELLDNFIITAGAVLGVNALMFLYHNLLPARVRTVLGDRMLRLMFKNKQGQSSLPVDRIGDTDPSSLHTTEFHPQPQSVSAETRAKWERIKLIILIVDGVIIAIVMWMLLIMFTAYRGGVNRRMGSGNVNNQWNFGQVLSVAAWVPVTIDLLTVYIYGAQEALDSKLSENYRVVENEDKGAEPGNRSNIGEKLSSIPLDPYQSVVALEATQYGSESTRAGGHTGQD